MCELCFAHFNKHASVAPVESSEEQPAQSSSQPFVLLTRWQRRTNRTANSNRVSSASYFRSITQSVDQRGYKEPINRAG
uniref:Uncharacterized protein n=1 Tax=Setaria digitata TaxID=48799 RepID=A0A915PYQ4_9BILA